MTSIDEAGGDVRGDCDCRSFTTAQKLGCSDFAFVAGELDAVLVMETAFSLIEGLEVSFVVVLSPKVWFFRVFLLSDAFLYPKFISLWFLTSLQMSSVVTSFLFEYL